MAILIFTIFYHGIGFSFLCLHNYIATKNLKEPLKCICNMHIRTCNLGVPYNNNNNNSLYSYSRTLKNIVRTHIWHYNIPDYL